VAFAQATEELLPVLLEQVRAGAIAGTPVDLGFARQSWQVQIDRPSPVLVQGSVYSNLDYMPYIEEGRRPGSRPPPSSALYDWVARKLGIAAKDIAGVAFVVARAIGQRGLPALRPLGKAVEANAALAQQIFTRDIPARVAALQTQKF
jgi:hypothetical protein